MFTTGTASKYCSLLLLFALSLFLASSSHCYEDDVPVPPLLDLQKCQTKCFQRQFDYNTTQQIICVTRCHDRFIQDRLANNGKNPQIDQKQCRRSGEGESNLLGKKKDKKHKEEEEKKKNPYYMEGQMFYSRFRTEEGHFRVLQRFSEKSDELLQGIDGYRLAIFEANPNTLLLPHHRDADAIFVVTHGKAIITFVYQKTRQSFNLERGDAIKVLSGTTMYLINPDNNEKLKILVLAHPINTPGHFEEFFGSGGENPRSFYRAFSKQLLRAALNIEEGKHEDFFQRQDQGTIVKLSLEQTRALIHDQEEGSSSRMKWGEPGSSSQGQGQGPEGEPGSSSKGQGQGQGQEGEPGSSSQEQEQGGASGESSQGEGEGGESGESSQEQEGKSEGPFNVLQQVKFSNELGQYFVASPDNTEQLRQQNIAVAFMNITQGAMILPYHNTRATVVLVVIGGTGEFEMASPHVARDSQEENSMGNKKEKHEKSSVQYEQIRAELSQGGVLIIPPGHPISVIASEDENLQLAGFGINVRYNYMQFLAGSDNIWNQVPPELQAISFNSEASEVYEVFGSQLKTYFVPGPNQSRQTEGETGHSMASILDAVGFI